MQQLDGVKIARVVSQVQVETVFRERSPPEEVQQWPNLRKGRIDLPLTGCIDHLQVWRPLHENDPIFLQHESFADQIYGVQWHTHLRQHKYSTSTCGEEKELTK